MYPLTDIRLFRGQSESLKTYRPLMVKGSPMSPRESSSSVLPRNKRRQIKGNAPGRMQRVDEEREPAGGGGRGMHLEREIFRRKSCFTVGKIFAATLELPERSRASSIRLRRPAGANIGLPLAANTICTACRRHPFTACSFLL